MRNGPAASSITTRGWGLWQALRAAGRMRPNQPHPHRSDVDTACALGWSPQFAQGAALTPFQIAAAMINRS